MKHFKYSEFLQSATADAANMKNFPPSEQEAIRVFQHIEALVDRVLDPLRDMLGVPLYITSGYRTIELNKKVCGSKTSQHLTGKAADISLGDYERNQLLVYNLLLGMQLGMLVVDQVILERVDRNRLHWGWVHVSYNEGRNRNEIKECYKGVYSPIDDEKLGRLLNDLHDLNVVQNGPNNRVHE